MGLFNFIDDVTAFWVSDIKAQTGKGFFRTFFDAGNYGEFQTYKYLFMLPGKMEFLHNCYVPIENGYAEIDLIMIHETGIYVIESKNYSGWVFGEEKQKTWTQVMAGGSEKNHFLNPIWQNNGHIKALKEYLTLYPDVPYFSLIVFSERCKLKKLTVSSNNVLVVNRDKMKSTLKKKISEREEYSAEKRKEIYKMLFPLCKMSKEDKQKHIDRINEIRNYQPKTSVIPRLYEKIEPPSNDSIVSESADQLGTCPRCGSNLILRNGKHGPFLGCSGFPQCKYTKNSILPYSERDGQN
jgi:hypothetical protein